MGRIVLLFLVMMSIASTAECKCLRCSLDSLICEGDEKFDIIAKCGEPDYFENTGTVTGGQISRGDIDFMEARTQKLYYNCGEGQFIEIITIRSGTIVSIEEGERGSGPVKCI